MSTEPTLSQLRAEFGRSRMLSLPIAGAVAWSAAGVLGAVLPDADSASIALFLCMPTVFPLGSVMGQHHKDREHPKCQRRDHEEIDRDELADMIRQEGTPGLGRRGPTADHVFSDRGFSDLDAELQQLAVDTRGTPGRVGVTHLIGGEACPCDV